MLAGTLCFALLLSLPAQTSQQFPYLLLVRVKHLLPAAASIALNEVKDHRLIFRCSMQHHFCHLFITFTSH